MFKFGVYVLMCGKNLLILFLILRGKFGSRNCDFIIVLEYRIFRGVEFYVIGLCFELFVNYMGCILSDFLILKCWVYGFNCFGIGYCGGYLICSEWRKWLGLYIIYKGLILWSNVGCRGGWVCVC